MPSFPPGSSNFESMQSLVIVLMIVCITAIVISQYASWAKNQSSPVQKRRARIVAKRSHVWGGGDDFPTSTTYYVTFEFADDGSRCELVVPDKEFGLMAEGDEGTLNYQDPVQQLQAWLRYGRYWPGYLRQSAGPNVRYTRRPKHSYAARPAWMASWPDCQTYGSGGGQSGGPLPHALPGKPDRADGLHRLMDSQEPRMSR